jgi:hypothetical protein
MDLRQYVDNLRQELATAAEAGGEEARALAERLAGSLESSVRLALLGALSAAADEITRDLAPGSVEVRLRGTDPEFVVTAPPTEQAYDESEPGPWTAPPPPAPPAPPDADDGGTSRITLRLPEHLKPRIDEAAGRAGLSVNAWLVRAVSAALGSDPRNRDPEHRTGTPFGRRYTGWVK